MTPNAELSRAIADAYAAFAVYGRPTVLDAAPSRDGAAILRTLCAAPLRQLTGEQIGPYSGWAMTTVGSVRDYKHFLPRILEQAVRRSEWMGTDPAILAERLNKHAQWLNWRPAEQDAVRRVYWAAWDQARHTHPNETDAADWLCGLAALGEDIAEALAQWLLPPSVHAALQVARLTMAMHDAFAGGEIEGNWSYASRERQQALLAWLASEGVRATLRDTAVETQDAWMIEKALAAHRRAMH